MISIKLYCPVYTVSNVKFLQASVDWAKSNEAQHPIHASSGGCHEYV